MVYIYAFALFSEYIEAFKWIQAIFDVGMSADDTAATRGKKSFFPHCCLCVPPAIVIVRVESASSVIISLFTDS